jgi:hypothetical protein
MLFMAKTLRFNAFYITALAIIISIFNNSVAHQSAVNILFLHEVVCHCIQLIIRLPAPFCIITRQALKMQKQTQINIIEINFLNIFPINVSTANILNMTEKQLSKNSF